MSLRDRVYDLQTVEEVNEFLEEFPTGAIFKAGGCHKTMEGFAQVEEALGRRKKIHVGFIRVIEFRPASNHVATLTSIQHESPQFILFVDGKAVFDLDNWAITLDALEPALEHHLGPADNSASRERASTDLTQYLKLLEQYVADQLSDSDFKSEWLITFQRDATPRSKEEVSLLNGLFGNVDQAIGHMEFGAAENGLKERAHELLIALKQ